MKRLLAAVTIAVFGFAAVGSAAPGDPTDLKVTKTANVSTVNVGETITYTIKVENLGPETATGVTVTDPLPKGVDYVSATTTAGTCSLQGQRVVCAIGTLETGAAAKVSSATVTLKVVARKAGTVTNTATVSGDQKDPVGSNDSASVSVKVIQPPAAATCRGVAATIVGTAASETLTGTGGRDVIVARGGNDAVFSFAGRDLVCAGRGSDRVVSGTAADRVFGNAGLDRLIGRGGADTLKGNAGNDVLKGNAGPDRLRGGSGFDVCRGGAGLDSIRGCEL
ncbi:MAG TPA: hypothetical protein VFM51_01995 [Solirubrobacterales bacterium]|nr:hypothetical protein [Solirubrobacterales bacterium]